MIKGNLKFGSHFELFRVVDNLNHPMDGYHWLPWTTINLVGDCRKLKFEEYLEVLYLFWIVDSVRTLNFYYCLSIVTIVFHSNH